MILTELSRFNSRNITVHLVIPFTTATSRSVIEQFRDRLNIKLYSSHQLAAFSNTVENALRSKVLSADAGEKLNELFFAGEKPLAYFDHKLPDDLSVVNNRYGTGDSVVHEIVIPTASGLKSFKILKSNQFKY